VKRRGIGTKLLIGLLERLAVRSVRNVWLEVREFNYKAISFYESHGFMAEVRRPNFFVNPTDNAVIMRLRMEPEQDVSEA
jgi:ribosomal-protein-alanine N-acetyltransferase